MSDEKTTTNTSSGDSEVSAPLPEMPLAHAGDVQTPTTPVTDPGPAPVASAPWASTAVPAYAPAEPVAAPVVFAESETPAATVPPAASEDWRESSADDAVVQAPAPAADPQPATRREARAQTGVVEPLPAQSTVVLPVAQPEPEQSRIDQALDLGASEQFEYPETRSNRGAAALIMLVAAVAFAVLYAALSAVVIGLASFPDNFVTNLLGFLLTPIFIVPVAVFAVLAIVLGVIGNRAGWWLYGVGGLIVSLLVAGSIIGWLILINGASLVNPFAEPAAAVSGVDFPSDLDQTIWLVIWVQVLAAGIAARESLLWFGAWAGRRGRKISQQNAEALASVGATSDS